MIKTLLALLSKNKAALLILAMLGTAMIQGWCERARIERLQDDHRAQIAELVQNVGILSKNTSVLDTTQARYEQYVTETKDRIRSLLANQSDLREFVGALEGRDKVIVERLDRVIASQDTIRISDTSSTTTSGDTTFVSFNTDTMGVKLQGTVTCPYGFTDITLSRDPIQFIATLERTKTGLKKKGIEFPDQPWIKVETWDIAISEPPRRGLISRTIGNIQPLAGVSYRGNHVGAMAGFRTSSIGGGVTFHTDLQPGFFLYKEFSLPWNRD